MFHNLSMFSERVLYFFIVSIIAVFLIYFLKWIKGSSKVKSKIRKLPPETWFYSQLLDIEIGKLNSKYFSNVYFQYLTRKYHISTKSITKDTLFKELEEKEVNKHVLDFQKNLFLEIESLKQTSHKEVVQYVKSIKFNFNQDDLREWLRKYHEDHCNDC